MGLSQFVDHHNGAPFHSSVYAKAAHGDAIGSTNTQSFDERVKIERGRQAVRRYGDSLIGRGHMRDTAHTQTGALGARTVKRGAAMRPAGIKPSIPPRTFTEPRTRYNPYG